MRIGKVIGTVTPGRIHPALVGAQLKIVVPLAFNDLTGNHPVYVKNDYQAADSSDSQKEIHRRPGAELVVYDELSAGIGQWVAFSEGAEASMAFYPNNKPIDAYAGLILDTIEIDEATVQSLCNKK